MRHSTPLLFSLCLATLPATGRAQCGTQIFPGLPAPPVWTAAGSPYCVMGSVTLAGINVQPGVHIVVQGDFAVTIAGSFLAIGTAAQPIRFRAATGVQGGWQGIRLTGASGVHLEHCEFRDGNAAVMRITNCAPVLRHCTFSGNWNALEGGALVIDVAGADLRLEHCTLIGNRSQRGGGAIVANMRSGFDLVLQHCHLIANYGNRNANGTFNVGNFHGGAVQLTGDAVFEDCVLRGNGSLSNCGTSWGCTSRCEGGAIAAQAGDLVLRRCVFERNEAFGTEAATGGSERAYAYGGAVAYRGGTGKTLTVAGSVFTGNGAKGAGSSIYDYGGAIYAATGSVVLSNVTLARNLLGGSTNNSTSWHAGGAIHTEAGVGVQMDGSIAFGNVAQRNALVLSTTALSGNAITARYSCVEGGFAGTGMISDNPQFIGLGATAGEVILSPTSPCVDAGSPEVGANDCRPPGLGTPRNDMGAFGGPDGCGWPQSQAFALEVRPSRVRAGDVVELRTVGGTAGLPTGLLISAIDGVPLPSPVVMSLAGVLSPRPTWAADLPVPMGIQPARLTFHSVSLTAGLQLIVTLGSDVWIE